MIAASATDVRVKTILRYDANLVAGISNTVKENRISDLLLGLHVKKNMSDSFFGRLTMGLLSKCNCTIYIYRPVTDLHYKAHFVISRRLRMNGFSFWL